MPFLWQTSLLCQKRWTVQLATDMDVIQKTAWHILHKVRALFKQDEDVVLEGVVECDEMEDRGGQEDHW